MEGPQVAVSITVFAICMLLGVPVWWNTTKVYRAQLPHEKIIAVQDMPVKLAVNVEVLLDNKVMKDTSIAVLSFILNQNKHVSAGISQYKFNFEINKTSMDLDTDLKHFCQKLESVYESRRYLNYRFHIFHGKSLQQPVRYYCDNSLDTILIDNYLNVTDIGDDIVSLMKLYVNIDDSPSYKAFKRIEQKPLSMPPAVRYSTVFTLAVANPSHYTASWDIEGAINIYLNPLLSKLNFLGPIKVSSQVLYFVDFKEKPYKGRDNYYYLKAKLPLLMNEIQPRLNTYISTDATLNFIVYIPPVDYVPLSIKSDKDASTTSSAFHSTRWGGLQFYNPNVSRNDNNPSNDSRNDSKVVVPIHALMKNFLLQFQELIGLSHSKYIDIFPENDVKQISEWSRMSLLLSKNAEYLCKCLKTLTSLYKLLDEIENIVISEEIRFLIEGSLNNYDESVRSLSSGLVEDAVKHSKSAFEHSEKAFYDSSLLALLYFPDDQKYAIYVPLFLPIAFPVLASVVRSVKWLKMKRGA